MRNRLHLWVYLGLSFILITILADIAFAWVGTAATATNTVITRVIAATPNSVETLSGIGNIVTKTGLISGAAADYGATFMSVAMPALKLANWAGIALLGGQAAYYAYTKYPEFSAWIKQKCLSTDANGNVMSNTGDYLPPGVTLPAGVYQISRPVASRTAAAYANRVTLAADMLFGSTSGTALLALGGSIYTASSGKDGNMSGNVGLIPTYTLNAGEMIVTNLNYNQVDDGNASGDCQWRQYNYYMVQLPADVTPAEPRTSTIISPADIVTQLKADAVLTSGSGKGKAAHTLENKLVAVTAPIIDQSLQTEPVNAIGNPTVSAAPDKLSAPDIASILQQIRDSLSPAQLTSIGNAYDPAKAATALNTAPTTATQEPVRDLTEDVHRGVSEALGDAPAAPDDPTPALPDQKNLTSILQTYLNQIKSLSILSSVSGMTITCTGSSVLCLQPGSCVDFATWQTQFSYVGTILFWLTSASMILYLFKG